MFVCRPINLMEGMPTQIRASTKQDITPMPIHILVSIGVPLFVLGLQS